MPNNAGYGEVTSVDIKPVFLFRRKDGNYVIKTVHHWDWKCYDARWMDDPNMGIGKDAAAVTTPDVDIVDMVIIVDTEREALLTVAQLYAKQLYEMTIDLLIKSIIRP